uniref:Uncharacterized protein n=1 Tax=Anolis carolinensis TaxID=28377 RepID=A0A803TH29_ANOCA
MASNSIFDSFASYPSSFLRGEYRPLLLSFLGGRKRRCLPLKGA